MQFDGTEKEIGRGAQAVVYLYKGFAYKVYKETYPPEWIAFERRQQDAVYKAGFTPVKYYATDDPHITRMDFIDGITLGDRMMKEKYEKGMDDLLALQKLLHVFDVTGIDIPSINDSVRYDLDTMNVSDDKRGRVLQILKEIPEEQKMCHLDFHFLNIMYTPAKSVETAAEEVCRNQKASFLDSVSTDKRLSGYTVIDWINARIGNPIFDFARTYVLFNEFSDNIAQEYFLAVKAMLWKEKIPSDWFSKAIFVCALLRQRERKSDKSSELESCYFSRIQKSGCTN